MATTTYDGSVVVLGAGPAGAAAAALLARHGIPTVLVGRSGDQHPGVGECLPPTSRTHLEKAGVWDTFLRANHVPSSGIRAHWGGPEAVDRDFVLSPYGAGWHIDRARFDAMMHEAALGGGAQALSCTALRKVTRLAAGWRLELASGDGQHEVECSFVIDATGRSSAFARRAGAQRRSLDKLIGLVAYFSAPANPGSIEAILLVEAVENGWWYTAPLPDGKLVAVFLTDAAYVQAGKLSQTEQWLALLRMTDHQHLRIQTHGGILEGGIRIMPADSSFLDQVAGDGWIAAGDAAAAFDPLSSQGLTSAVSGGMRAAQAVVAQMAGDAQAVVGYANTMRREYAQYLAHREIYYRIERRWPSTQFWQTRHKQTALMGTGKNSAAMGARA